MSARIGHIGQPPSWNASASSFSADIEVSSSRSCGVWAGDDCLPAKGCQAWKVPSRQPFRGMGFRGERSPPSLWRPATRPGRFATPVPPSA